MAYSFTVSPHGISSVVRHYVLSLKMLFCYHLLERERDVCAYNYMYVYTCCPKNCGKAKRCVYMAWECKVDDSGSDKKFIWLVASLRLVG